MDAAAVRRTNGSSTNASNASAPAGLIRSAAAAHSRTGYQSNHIERQVVVFHNCHKEGVSAQLPKVLIKSFLESSVNQESAATEFDTLKTHK